MACESNLTHHSRTKVKRSKGTTNNKERISINYIKQVNGPNNINFNNNYNNNQRFQKKDYSKNKESKKFSIVKNQDILREIVDRLSNLQKTTASETKKISIVKNQDILREIVDRLSNLLKTTASETITLPITISVIITVKDLIRVDLIQTIKITTLITTTDLADEKLE